MFQHLRTKCFLYARMALLHCSKCGLAYMERVLPAGRAYCFFHGQDEAAFGKDDYLVQPLFISWGIVQTEEITGTPEEWLRCAEHVVTAGILAGLQVTWEGTAEKRIALHPTRKPMQAPHFISSN